MLTPLTPLETKAACPQPLLSLRPGQAGRVHQAPDLPMLAALGVRPGKPLQYVSRSWWQGPLLCRVEGRTFALDQILAEQIHLVEVVEVVK